MQHWDLQLQKGWNLVQSVTQDRGLLTNWTTSNLPLALQWSSIDTDQATAATPTQTSPSFNQPSPVPRWKAVSPSSTAPAGIDSCLVKRE